MHWGGLTWARCVERRADDPDERRRLRRAVASHLANARAPDVRPDGDHVGFPARGPRVRDGPSTKIGAMQIHEFQRLIERIYGDKDASRGTPATFMWFAEEVGELSRALRKHDPHNLAEEFADVFAWLVTLASMNGVELDDAVRKYAGGCPRCGSAPCRCDEARRQPRTDAAVS